MIVETMRLRLREITVDDAAFILELVNDPSFIANIGDKGLRTLDQARQFILTGSWTRQLRPGYGQFAVAMKDSGDPIGVCGLLYRESLDVSDVGFAFLPQYRGRGFAYEAAAAVIAYGHWELGIERIVALTSKDNLASIKVLEKLGMKYEKTVKMSEDDPGTDLYS